MNWLKRKKNEHSSPLSSPVPEDYARLVKAVCELAGFSKEELLSSQRTQRLALWRMVLFYILRKQGATFQEVGNYFNRNHATVIYGCRRIEELAHDKEAMKILERITTYGGDTHNK
jgi:chromosomal replication initiation ATPase DnaA